MKEYCIPILISLVLLMGLYGISCSQSQPIQFEHIGLEQGLSQTDVHYIIQDHKGYLWFATTDGLNKYDGYTFTTYKYDPSDSTSLGQNTCLMLYEDKQGMIWVGHVGRGISKFDPTTELFTRYPPKRAGAFTLHNGLVLGFNEDAEDMLWVGTGGFNGLVRFDKKTGRFHETAFKPPGVKKTSWINTIYQDKTGIYWIGSDIGLHRAEFIPTSGKQPSRIKFTYNLFAQNYPAIFKNVEVISVFEDHRNILWFGTETSGLIRYDRKTNTIRQYKHDPNNLNSLSDNHIGRGAIAEDQQGNLWIGCSTGGGLNKLDPKRNQITRYAHNLENETSLSGNEILALLVDRSNILWNGTVGGGISKFDPNKRSFPLYHHILQNTQSLVPKGVRALYEDKAGIVWVGTEGGGLDRLDKKTGKFTHFTHDAKTPKSLSNDFVPAILEDRDDNFWIGTADGLSKLDRQTGTFTRHFNDTTKPGNPDDAYIFTLFQDHAGLIWMGTLNGLKRINPKTGAVTHYYQDPTNPESLSDHWAYAICEDQKRNLWIGTYDGLNYLNRKTGKFKHYKHQDSDSHSISSNTIRSLYLDEKGTLWVGTLGGGFCRFDEKTGAFQTFTEKDGLANNSVYAIQPDQAGHLWLATNKGLSRFSPNTHSFVNFDVSDGLQSDQFATGYQNAGTSFKGKNGVLYFGGINGFNVFDPAKIQLNQWVPAIVITQFKLFDKRVPGQHEDRTIELAYDQNFISFEFAALNYTNTQKNLYAYQLVGLEKDWMHSGRRRYVSYTNLDPGTYVFRVKGSNNDGIWNEKGASITVIIHPPWWETLWFRVLLTVCLVLIAGVSIRLYTRSKLRRQRSDMKRVLQAQEEERQRLAADLHDDLGATLSVIKGKLQTIQPPTDGLAGSINLMEKAIGDLRHISHNLMPPEFAKLGLAEAIRETVRRAEVGSPIHFLFITHGQERRLDEETELTIYRIAIELITNAIKHAKARQVTIQLLFYPANVTLLVEDDGKGYPVSSQDEPSGIGLRNIPLAGELPEVETASRFWRTGYDGYAGSAFVRLKPQF